MYCIFYSYVCVQNIALCVYIICVYVYVYVCVCVCVCMCMYVYVYVRKCICVWVYMCCVYVHVCEYVSIFCLLLTLFLSVPHCGDPWARTISCRLTLTTTGLGSVCYAQDTV